MRTCFDLIKTGLDREPNSTDICAHFSGRALRMQRVNLSPLKLASASGLRPEASRPPHLRQRGHDEDFDWLTIFYHCILAAYPRWIVLMGPPLCKLDEVVLFALKAA